MVLFGLDISWTQCASDVRPRAVRSFYKISISVVSTAERGTT